MCSGLRQSRSPLCVLPKRNINEDENITEVGLKAACRGRLLAISDQLHKQQQRLIFPPSARALSLFPLHHSLSFLSSLSLSTSSLSLPHSTSSLSLPLISLFPLHPSLSPSYLSLST